MKADPEVKMISAEAPIIFAKACETFITELTMRAWIHAEENKRRTLQRSDIAAALGKSDMFDFLTLSVVINDQIFCVHGGLSPSIHSIDQIKIIDRFREIPHEGPMADLVWSDPDPERDEFSLSPRGAGYTFGAQVVKKFLEVNSMSHILRAHQLCQEGYQVLYDDRLSTVWSAPNYCYRCGNMASVLEVSDTGERFFNVFDASPDNDVHRAEQQQALLDSNPPTRPKM